MPLDPPRHGQGGESRELVTEVRIEPLDGLDQPEVADLHDVVQRLAAVLELAGQEVDEVPIGVNPLRPNAIPLFGVGGLLVATVEHPPPPPAPPRPATPFTPLS